MKNYLFNLAMIFFAVSNVFSQTQDSNNPASTTGDDSSYDTSVSKESTVNINSNSFLKIKGWAPEIVFDEHPYNHNMHITGDGNYYYTINGGSASSGQINQFSLTGALIQTYYIQIDGRGLSYNQSDGFLYASLYMGDIVKITDLNTGSFTTIFTSIMQNDQASFAISPDGSRFYDFFEGTLLIHDFYTGSVIDTLTGLLYGPGNYGGQSAVAVDMDYIYTWDATIKTVYMYDQLGTLIHTSTLDFGDNGHSISVANDYLFVSRDGNYDVGTWYGYDILGFASISEYAESNLNVYPNPAQDKITISLSSKTGNTQLSIFNVNGEKVLEMQLTDTEAQIDISTLPRGVYFARVQDEKMVEVAKMVKE